MQFSSETVRVPRLSGYLIRGTRLGTRKTFVAYLCDALNCYGEAALNPNQGKRVVSPMGATAVTTPLSARSEAARARCLTFVEMAWAVAVPAR